MKKNFKGLFLIFLKKNKILKKNLSKNLQNSIKILLKMSKILIITKNLSQNQLKILFIFLQNLNHNI